MTMRRATVLVAAFVLGILAGHGQGRADSVGDASASDAVLLAAAADSRAGDKGGERTQGGAADSSGQVARAEGQAKVCLTCHNKPEVTGIFHRAHAQKGDSRTPFAQAACSSCHGNPGQHMRNPTQVKPEILFGADKPTPVRVQNGVCLDCHQGGGQLHWQSSAHATADMVCSECHDSHAARSPVGFNRDESNVCFTCHQAVRSQTFRRSHHPIREDEMACSDCHNPHGSAGPAQLVEISVNETCYECHQDKRGPFLWEHQPVREDCGICHEPHGSTQPNLLISRGPWLCQNCHSAQFHPSAIYDGNAVRNLDPHTLAQNCINCHPKVHGSNHPSGVRFTR